MRTKKEIHIDLDALNKKANDISEEMEILRNELEATNSKNLYDLLPNSTWILSDSNLVFKSKTSNNKDDIDELVCKDFGLWPHGRAQVSKNVEVVCDDGSIILRATLTSKDFSTASPSENVARNIIIKFAKENKIIIDLNSVEKNVEYRKRQYENAVKELENIRESLK